MDDLKPLAVFAETVAAGSMSAAARRLGMSPSAVSQMIRALERQGGVTLLHRSTRKLALTEAGERYYPHCKRMLDAARAAAESLQQARDAPTGELRVSAPVGFAKHIAPALAPLLAEAPQLRLRLLMDDSMIDLIDARIDLAIRVGHLADSSWVARRLCDFGWVLCASPTYLEHNGTPTQPEALQTQQWLAVWRAESDGAKVSAPHDGLFAPEGTGKTAHRPARTGARGALSTSEAVSMPLDMHAADGKHRRVQIEARIASNNLVALQQMCEHGLGIARLVRADVLPQLQSGALVEVLAPWRMPPIPVWAVTPRRDGDAAKVSAALACLKRYFATLPGSTAA